MAITSTLTPLEKRTATLLTVVGVLGSLLGIAGIALPYFLFSLFSSPPLFSRCDGCQSVQVTLRPGDYVTVAIVLLSIGVSFLPRMIYGARLRKVKHERGQRGKEDIGAQS